MIACDHLWNRRGLKGLGIYFRQVIQTEEPLDESLWSRNEDFLWFPSVYLFYCPSKRIIKGIIIEISIKLVYTHSKHLYTKDSSIQLELYRQQPLKATQLQQMIQKKEFPTLQSLALQVVAHNYHLYPELTGLSQRLKQTIIQKSIESGGQNEDSVLIAAPHIGQQKYWKACCQRNHKLAHSMKLEDHGFSFKIAYLEQYIERLLQNCQSYKQQRSKILNAVKILSPWIFTLQIKINSPDINIQEICQYLYNLINLKVRCAEGKNMDYKKKIIGMKFTEARDLAEILKSSQNIIGLNLTGNLIDDELFKLISPGLTLNTSLVDLNLSYNKIGDEGARKLSKFLIKNQILTHLNLSNNAIGFDGSRYLAQALKLNSTLQSLSLKLNAIDDKAGAKFFKDLTFNTNLKILDVSTNLLSTMTVRKICLYLQGPNSLRQIYIGSNNFSESDLVVIADALPSDKCKESFVKSKYMEIRL